MPRERDFRTCRRQRRLLRRLGRRRLHHRRRRGCRDSSGLLASMASQESQHQPQGRSQHPPPPTEAPVLVSNRLPDMRSAQPVDGSRKNVGGLVSALEPILAARHGLWLGWGGRVVPDSEEPTHGVTDTSGVDDGEGTPALAWFDYKQSWLRDYYNGFCNATLWPSSIRSRVACHRRNNLEVVRRSSRCLRGLGEA